MVSFKRTHRNSVARRVTDCLVFSQTRRLWPIIRLDGIRDPHIWKDCEASRSTLQAQRSFFNLGLPEPGKPSPGRNRQSSSRHRDSRDTVHDWHETRTQPSSTNGFPSVIGIHRPKSSTTTLKTYLSNISRLIMSSRTLYGDCQRASMFAHSGCVSGTFDRGRGYHGRRMQHRTPLPAGRRNQQISAARL
jgi:hypothetical protein